MTQGITQPTVYAAAQDTVQAAMGAEAIAELVQSHLHEIASTLRPDVLDALCQARSCESSMQAVQVLDMLIENAHLADRKSLPLCQDTGTVWVLIEMGAKVQADLSGLQDVLDKAVTAGFKTEYLRASTVRDALSNRSNPGNNTPAFVEIVQRASAGNDSDFELSVSTMLKGAGTDNASAVYMLPPSTSKEEIAQRVVDLICEKGANACPPLIVGIGIGATFDKVAGLSKRALLRPLDQTASTEEAAQLEQDILQLVNVSKIGPAGLGGDTTALAVHVETAPSHIASLPIAINLCCHSLRSRSTTLKP